MSTGPRLSIRAVRSLGRALRHVPAWRGRHIGPRLRELVILHVSSVNGCPVCSAAHGLIGRAIGLDHDQIQAARACDPPSVFDDRTRLALRFAELRATDTRDDDVEARVAATFTAPEREELAAIVDLFIFNNRANNTWEALLPGAAWRRRALGLCDPES